MRRRASRLRAACLLLLLAAACGRIGYDAPPGEDIDDAAAMPDGAGIDDAPPVRETWTLGERPGAMISAVTADTRMCDFAPGDDQLNWGASGRFEGGVYCTGLLRFDLSDLPAGARIVDATIELWPELIPSVPGHVEVYRVTEAWIEGTENGAPGAASYLERTPGTPWTTPGGRPPGSADPSPIHTFSPTVFDAILIPLPASLVQTWLDDPTTNHGLAFVGFDYGDPDTEHPTSYPASHRRPRCART